MWHYVGFLWIDRVDKGPDSTQDRGIRIYSQISLNITYHIVVRYMLDLLNFAKFVNFKRQETSSSLDLRTNSNVPICKAASDNKKPALQPGIWDLLMCNGMQTEAMLQTNLNLYIASI